MWVKVFVVLRLPVGVICMIGYVSALSLSSDQRMGALGAALTVGADFFLWVTSVKLFRRRKSASVLAWWLLALETVGGVLLLRGADYTNMRVFDLSAALVVACIVLVFWTLPNALLFYKARKLFSESAKEKPGL
jgi:hypothetical protein